MSVTGIRNFITDFNSKNYTLRNKGDGAPAYSSQVMYTKRGPVEGVDNGDVRALFQYRANNEACSVDAEDFFIDKYTVDSETKDQSEGVIYVRGKDEGAGYLFAVEGGGKDETGVDEYASLKYVRTVIPWDEAEEGIFKALGVELINNKVSNEAKSYVNSIDMNKLVNGYVDENGVVHAPYTVRVFPSVADNVYIRLRLNPNKFGTREGLICFVDYSAGIVYAADDVLTEAMTVLKDAHAFDTEIDRNIRELIDDGDHVSIPTRNLISPQTKATSGSNKEFDGCITFASNPTGHDGGYVNTSELVDYINRERGNAFISYAKIETHNGSSGRNCTITAYLTPNDFTGSWSSGSGGSHIFNMACNSTQQRKITVCGKYKNNDPTTFYMELIETGTWAPTVEWVNVFSYYRLTFYSTAGSFPQSVVGSPVNQAIVAVAGFPPISEKTGDTPTDYTVNVSDNYTNWNNNAVNMLMYKAPKIGQTISVNELKEYKKLLPFNVFASDQSGTQSGDVTGDELKELSQTEFSDKIDLEDEGTTVDGVDEIGIGAGFMHLYYTDANTVSEVYQKALISQDLGDVIAKFYAGDLSKAIIDIYRLPFECSKSNPQDIKLSACTINGTQGYEQTNRVKSIDFGTVEIEPKFNDQRDYSPITRITIYLPFSGYHNLDVDDMVNSQIHLRCKVDKMSGNGVYDIQIERNDMDAILYTFPMSCRLEYPVSFSQSKNTFSAFLGLASGTAAMAAGGGAGGLAGMMMGGAGVMGALNAMKPVQARGGNIGDVAGWLSSLVPYIIINRPGYGEPEHFEQIAGRAANTDVILGTVKGYTVIRDVHIEGIDSATAWEKDKIATLLKSGVIL